MSPDFTPTQNRINDLLAQQLRAVGCWGGRLHLRPTSGAGLVSLSGHHHTGKDVMVFPIELPLKRMLGLYAEEQPGGIGLLTIDADLRRQTYQYHHVSTAAQAQADARAAAAEAQERITRQQEHHAYLRQHLSVAPYGAGLATAVAAALRKGGGLAHSHRDYCGTGLDYHNGTFRYGDVWDGGLAQLLHTFTGEAAFVAWLAQQSDASLARLNEQDAFYWNNQTLNRQRLEDFAR